MAPLIAHPNRRRWSPDSSRAPCPCRAQNRGFQPCCDEALKDHALVEDCELATEAAGKPDLRHCPPMRSSSRDRSDRGRGRDLFGAFALRGDRQRKTEVYLQSVADCLNRAGRHWCAARDRADAANTGAIRVSVRGPVIALHSGMGDAERDRAWAASQRSRSGDSRHPFLGFCPSTKARLIIVDEEHDAAYVQQDGFDIRHAMWR